jgi:hypothetical protein
MAGESRESEVLKEIPASEILAKIEKGEPIDYRHVTIKGNLDISKLNLPKERGKFLVTSPIKIVSSQMDGNANFYNAFFREGVEFQSSQFIKNTNFSGSIFASNADFGNSQYDGSVSFNKSQFYEDVSFHRSQFLGITNFSNSRFNKDIYFRKSQFSKDLIFNRSYFEGDAYFRESVFYGKADYRKSQFHKDADFSQCSFVGTIADFELVQFLGDAFFDDASFKESLSLSRTKYEKLYIRWKSVTRSKYQWKFLENWRRISNLIYEKDHGETAYLLLIENFKKLGFFEDADNCYYHYRNEHRRDLPNPYKPADWILMVLYGYGVRPIRPLIWAIIFFCAFGLLYATHGGTIGFARAVSPIDALNVSYTLLLSGTKLIDDPNHAATGTLYFIFTLEKLLGSLFFALFLVSVGRTIVR